jgi:hypothetical protein
MDLVVCHLVACSAQSAGCEKAVTFGRQAARSDLFELIR